MIALCSVAVVLVALLLLSWGARRFVGGHDELVCVVTDESLATPGNFYDGGDHPLDPAVGDEYLGSSGCNRGELHCVRKVELFGSRTDC